ncbi:MAG: S8 family peptidase [Gemmatimonadota bacterium]
MKPLPVLVAFAFAFSACAPITPASAPAPTRVEAPTPPPTPERPAATEPLEVVPDRWWLLDAATDAVVGASVDRAYSEILSQKQPRRQVVVAIIDSGVDITHEDLDDVLWTNDDEVANGRDDDGNGYVDDVHGWNFIGGPDGRHVDDDTYEVTRLHATCENQQRGATHAAALPGITPTAAECTEIAAEFAGMRAENEQMLAQVRQMDAAVTTFVALLRQHMGTDSLTVEGVRALAPVQTDVRQAQQIYLQLADNDITPTMIRNEVERIESLLENGLNPDFNPRGIVGDDYADRTQRVYGNAGVTGPDASHGTGVAGIVAAERENDIGVEGIADAVRIMTIRAVPNGDERDKDVANAIRYAVDNGADIINMSFGKAYSPNKDVVDAAVRHAEEQGVLLIHAAGNDAKDLAAETNFPNRYYETGGAASNWIEVGASSWEGREQLAANFSNFGSEQVDVFAPGATILAATPGDDYAPNSGTSFAAPVVTGVAALLMAYYPDLSVADVRRIILESATRYADQVVAAPGPPGRQVRFGELSATGAVVNAYEAVRMAEQTGR